MSVLAFMRIKREAMVFKAVCALDEAVEATRRAPVAPSFALRFALAYLYAVTDGDRALFDSFWRAVQRPDEKGVFSQTRFERAVEARRLLRRIALLAGLTLTGEVELQIEQMRRRRA